MDGLFMERKGRSEESHHNNQKKLEPTEYLFRNIWRAEITNEKTMHAKFVFLESFSWDSYH